MSRRLAREAALQTLYQIDLVKSPPEAALDFTITEFQVKPAMVPFVRELVLGTLEQIPYIDGVIKKAAIDWNLERMAAVDRNILRLAMYELFFRADIPANVSLNEAIELGKTFSTAESGKFINGILGKVVHQPELFRVEKVKV
ncbi:transcription antitermination factor NusB [bacterium]|nr:MAG: transcription antitermination factor NusB [bacterium]